MKKLKLKALSLGAREILSREQLRSVIGAGGDGTTHGGSPCNISFDCEPLYPNCVNGLCQSAMFGSATGSDGNVIGSTVAPDTTGCSSIGTETYQCYCPNNQNMGCYSEYECSILVCQD